jgi:hypothetical protein
MQESQNGQRLQGQGGLIRVPPALFAQPDSTASTRDRWAFSHLAQGPGVHDAGFVQAPRRFACGIQNLAGHFRGTAR